MLEDEECRRSFMRLRELNRCWYMGSVIWTQRLISRINRNIAASEAEDQYIDDQEQLEEIENERREIMEDVMQTIREHEIILPFVCDVEDLTSEALGRPSIEPGRSVEVTDIDGDPMYTFHDN